MLLAVSGFLQHPWIIIFYSKQIASSRTFCVYKQVCLKSPIIVLFSLPRCCHTLIISFDMIDFYNQLKNCDIKASLSFFPLKLLLKAWWFCLTLSYVQGGWKHYKEKFTVMKKNPEFTSRQASDIGQGGNKLW